ncbi:glycosyltransferase family 4 protein [Rhodopirellula sp. JC639]|uniref:glycosyltransferase family 4 protein n=1 Tax=Stieleria mannarensis TaxID=2755585 RepID=UPI0016026F13|nr:glycosyltransferase family 4 protein [Rhodopirellula sp. JC639]
MNRRILLFMATRSPVGGVATWLDRFCRHMDDQGWKTTVALVRGQREHDPARFRKFHSNLNTVQVDGRGLDREGRIRACRRAIRKANPIAVLPLGVLDANASVVREKVAGRAVHLIGRAQGNLPAMLADLQDLRDGLDHVVCVGAMTRRYLIRYAGFESERVTHVPNGASRATTERRPRTDGPIRLGYVGRLSIEDKRVLDIPILCRHLVGRGVPFHLTIVGSGPAEKPLRDQLAEFGDRVRMVGFKNSEQVYSEYLPDFDLLLLFSSSETFGVALAEAMMNGVVPVTSRYLGFESERLVVDGKHGLSYPVGEMSAAADAIEKLTRSPQLMKSLSLAGKRHAEEQYSWDVCQRQWLALIERVTAEHPITPGKDLCQSRNDDSGRLDRWGIPPAWVDTVRQLRRRMIRSGWQDGVEWPLFHRTHSPERLAEIDRSCRAIETEQRSQSSEIKQTAGKR